MIKLIKAGWIAAFAGAALTYPIAAIVVATSVEAWRITPEQPNKIEGNRALFEFDNPDRNAPGYAKKVAEIYGTPVDKPARYLFVSKERLIRPKEKPDLVLLPIDPQKGESAVEVEAVYFVRKWALIVAAAVGGVLLALWALLQRRRAEPVPPTP